MSDFCKWMLVALLFSSSVATGETELSKGDDFTKRHSDFADKELPMKIRELKVNEQFAGKRIPIKEWHAEFSPIGNRRSPISMRERSEKTMIRPEVIEMKTFDRKLAPASGRMAYVRNFDEVRETPLVPKYRDAEVVTVKEMSRPAQPGEQKEISMRDLNRFSFQRNHSDSGGVEVQRTTKE